MNKRKIENLNKSLWDRFAFTNPFRSAEISPKKGYYPYITSGLRALKVINAAQIYFKAKVGREAKSFIDLGCGLGGVLIQARQLGLTDVTGVEYHPKYVVAAKKIIQENPDICDGIKIIHTDIFQWKPNRKYDIVYFWTPIADHVLCKRLYEHMLKFLPDNQFIIAFGTNAHDIFDLKPVDQATKNREYDWVNFGFLQSKRLNKNF